MSQTKVHTINIKNDFQNGFINTSKIGRPNTRDNNPRSETFVFRNNHIVATKKAKPQKPINEPNMTQNTFVLGQTFHPKFQAALRDATLDSQGKDDTIPSQGRDPRFFRDSHLTPEEIEYENRENKFRTINARGQNRPDLSFLEAGNQSKMSTLQPNELNVNALRARIVEQIRRNKSRNEDRGKTLDVSILPELSKKKSHNDSGFPQILAPKITISEKINQIENIYTLTPPKRSSKANIREEANRAKSNQRGSNIIKEKLEIERRAISQIRMAENPHEIKLFTPQKPIQTKILKPNTCTENKLDHSILQMNPSNSKNSSAIFILESPERQPSPRPPATDQPEIKARAKSNVRPRLKEIKNKSPLKILDRLNASDFIYQEFETNYYFAGSAGPSTRGQVLIEEFPKPSEGDFTSHQTEERSSFKGITHHKTQPQLEDRDNEQNQNNKSVDAKLRQTVDSQHDISYVEKENPKSFVISPPYERKGKFTRKPNNVIKREDSNKNILDEFAEKSVKISTEEQHITRERSVSKSPFDEIMETSLMSYEKDSMIQSRTKKEIDSILSIKHPHFKRSKVIVSKGHHGSAEKDGSHNTSTNISNSKSTNKYESMQGKGKEDFFAPSANSIKNENMEIDFGFEDDLTVRQKTDKSPTLKDSKRPVLNVIAEEMNQHKETIRASLTDNCIIESEEYDRSEGEANRTPSSKMSSVKPLYFYTAGKLNKNPTSIKNEKEKQSTLSQKLQEDDDICVNGACLENDEEYTKTIENNVENSLTNI